MKIKKGMYGYLKAKRKQMVFVVAGMLAAVLLIYFGALAYFGTNETYFTIVAVLICLPMAKFAVDMIMVFRAGNCSEQAHESILQHVGTLENAYDLYMTSYSENFQISHAAAAGKSVIAYTESDTIDCKAGENHIRRMLQKNNFHGYTVKIFQNIDKYNDRLDQMQELMSEDQREKMKELMVLLGQISL